MVKLATAFPIHVFNADKSLRCVVKASRKETTLPSTGERFGGTDWANPRKMSDFYASGLTFKLYNDSPPRGNSWYKPAKGTPIITEDSITETYTLEPTMSFADAKEKKALDADITARVNIGNHPDTAWQTERKSIKDIPVDAWVGAFRDDTVAMLDAFILAMAEETDYDALVTMQPEWPSSADYLKDTWEAPI